MFFLSIFLNTHTQDSLCWSLITSSSPSTLHRWDFFAPSWHGFVLAVSKLKSLEHKRLDRCHCVSSTAVDVDVVKQQTGEFTQWPAGKTVWACAGVWQWHEIWDRNDVSVIWLQEHQQSAHTKKPGKAKEDFQVLSWVTKAETALYFTFCCLAYHKLHDLWAARSKVDSERSCDTLDG